MSLPGHADLPTLGWDWNHIAEGLGEAVHWLGPRRLHVHHMLFNESWLGAFLGASGLPYDITLHDYYFLALQPHLLDEEDRFAGDARLNDEALARPAWA